MIRIRFLARIAAAAALIGAFVTPQAAASEFTEADISAIQAFTKRMLERSKTGSSTTWRSGDGVLGGRVTITTTDHQPGAQPCRTYEWTMRRQTGAEMTGIGRGCRDGAGNWALEETRSERQSSLDLPPPPKKVTPPKNDPAPKTAEKPATRSTKPKPALAVKETEAPSEEEVAATEAAPEPTPAERLAELEFTPPPRTLSRDAPAPAQDAEQAQ